MSLFDQRIRSVEEPKKCKKDSPILNTLYHVYRLPLLQWICSNGGGKSSCFGFLFFEANAVSFS